MNEKIKELAEQAEEYIEVPMPNEIYNLGDGVFRKHKTFNREKFAELIVAECTRCMTESTIQLGESFDKTMVPWLLQDLSKQIRQHFGVEE